MAVRYWERIEAVSDGLAEKVPVRNSPKREEVFRRPLVRTARLHCCRTTGTERRGHETMRSSSWPGRLRLGGLRALDIRDYYPDDGYVWFRHRPGEGTPLKKDFDSERVVSIPDRMIEAIDAYIDQYRYRVRDEHGRRPLFTSQQDRSHKNTFRMWSYQMTQPCIHGNCPHGEDPGTCEFRGHPYYSKCPSSKSTYPIRKGSISWHLGNGVPMEVVEARCDASREVIQLRYDMRSPEERMQHRRGTVLPKLTYA